MNGPTSVLTVLPRERIFTRVLVYGPVTTKAGISIGCSVKLEKSGEMKLV